MVFNRKNKSRLSFVLAIIMLLCIITAALPVFAATVSTTQSVTSLYMSNWTNAINIWMASKLSQNDTGTFDLRIGEMRISNDYSTNQIIDYSSFFRNETSSTGVAIKYTNI